MAAAFRAHRGGVHPLREHRGPLAARPEEDARVLGHRADGLRRDRARDVHERRLRGRPRLSRGLRRDERRRIPRRRRPVLRRKGAEGPGRPRGPRAPARASRNRPHPLDDLARGPAAHGGLHRQASRLPRRRGRPSRGTRARGRLRQPRLGRVLPARRVRALDEGTRARDRSPEEDVLSGAAFLVCAAGMLAFGVFPRALVDLARVAAAALSLR